MEAIHAILESEAEKESRTKLLHVTAVYDEVLAANRELDAKYKNEEDVMIKRLKEVQEELNEIKNIREERRRQASQTQEKKEKYTYFIVGKPYFKDRRLNHPPDNDDTKIMKQLNMYDFSNVMTVPGWSFGDRKRLHAVIFELATAGIRKKLQQEMALLKRVDTKSQIILTKIEEIKKELIEIKHKKLIDLDLKDIVLDWDEIAMKLSGRHSPKEYESIWTLFFNPRIKKSKWSTEEHQALQAIAQKRMFQDWDGIAKELNTTRTGYQCFVYYRTNMDHAASGRKWTQPEIENLRRVVSLYKEDNFIPWGKVASAMGNRTKIQCYNKYIRMVEARKGRFLPEEDSVILNFAEVYGPDYRQMVQYLYGRSAIQLRVRHRLLQQGVSATWTHEDDKKLLLLCTKADDSADSTAMFSAATKHFPGKDRLQLRSRYKCLLRWMKSNPTCDTRHAPRRAARRLAHGEPTRNLITAIQNLRNKMNEIVNSSDKPRSSQKHNRLTRDSSHKHIQDSLLSTISLLEVKRQMSEHRMRGIVRVQSWDAPGGTTRRVQDIASRRPQQYNVYNLKQALILLDANIHDKNAFYNCEIGSQLRDVEESAWSPHATRCYGREARAPHDALSGARGGTSYLLPPNFASITGSRVILAKLNSEVVCSAAPRPRTCAARAALLRLRTRFNDLFMWPYLLSNGAPTAHTAMSCSSAGRAPPLAPPPAPPRALLPPVPAVTIPSTARRGGGGGRGGTHVDATDKITLDTVTDREDAIILLDGVGKDEISVYKDKEYGDEVKPLKDENVCVSEQKVAFHRLDKGRMSISDSESSFNDGIIARTSSYLSMLEKVSVMDIDVIETIDDDNKDSCDIDEAESKNEIMEVVDIDEDVK